jgi:uncharacterized membrane protein (DUF2068 family)
LANRKYSLTVVALLEAVKGGVVIIGGFGLLSLLHRNVRHVAEALIRHLHLNPARHYPQIFLDAAATLNDARLWALAAAAGVYAAIRLTEAYGLWRDRVWAEWLAAVSGGIYIPFEFYELARGVTALRVITCSCNVLIVLLMVRALMQRQQEKAAGTQSSAR